MTDAVTARGAPSLPSKRRYDEATAITASEGGWTVDLDPSWSIGGFLNGGYLLIPMAAAASSATALPDP
ncbi:MAG: thioesterase family protein, partial [Acidimicrobiales bacterium]